MKKRRGRPLLNPGLKVLPLSGPPDYPLKDVPVFEDGKPTSLLMPTPYLPWADTIPRSELQEALNREDTPQAARFFEALADPQRAGLPISVLASQSGIRTRELLEIWRHYKQVEALGIAINGAPEVARQTVIDAQSVTVCCTRCDGAGMIRVTRSTGEEWITCYTCEGSGKMRRPGDAKSREWILRAAGVIKSDGGVVIQQNFTNPRADSILDELDRIDGAVLETVPISDDDA